MPPDFAGRVPSYQARITEVLDQQLSKESAATDELLAAMRYAALGGGKRIRPLTAYASGELLNVDLQYVDAIAAAIEMVHAYSLVHDDLPAMDDDDLRRGRPTVHRAYDEATAILVGDALQALAFETLTRREVFDERREVCADLVLSLARAAGGDGMVGGQALDIAYSTTDVNADAVEQMFARKTGRLIEAAIMMPVSCATDVDERQRCTLQRFASLAGIMFQIRDDVLEATRSTEELGKSSDSDTRNDRAAYPSRFGLATARARADELLAEARQCLDDLGPRAEGLRWVTEYIVERKH